MVGPLGAEEFDIAVGEPADTEVMQVRVRPTHRRLQNMMQLGKRDPQRHDEAAPDRRLDVVERDMDLDSIQLLPDRVLRGGRLR